MTSHRAPLTPRGKSTIEAIAAVCTTATYAAASDGQWWAAAICALMAVSLTVFFFEALTAPLVDDGGDCDG